MKFLHCPVIKHTAMADPQVLYFVNLCYSLAKLICCVNSNMSWTPSYARLWYEFKVFEKPCNHLKSIMHT